ncbi:MAG TPA: hypothetical protein V6C86_24890 [Oculatellaceae cyanobacterium]
MSEPTRIQSDNTTNSSRTPSVEEHLNLSDWSFKARIEQGKHRDYHWISLDYDVEFENYIAPPLDSFRILVTHFDGYGGAAVCYSNTPGWRRIGECAISDVIADKLPAINYAADTALMYLDRPLGDEELLAGLCFADEEPDPNNSRFWFLLDRIQPYLFISYMERAFFAAQNRGLLDALHSPCALAEVEERERASLRASRKSKWEDVGPECGPEKCVEPDCDRLRIKRAVRCYMHQLRAFGG